MGGVYVLTAPWLIFFSVAPAMFHVNTVSDESCKDIFPLMTLSGRENTTVLMFCSSL